MQYAELNHNKNIDAKRQPCTANANVVDLFTRYLRGRYTIFRAYERESHLITKVMRFNTLSRHPVIIGAKL